MGYSTHYTLEVSSHSSEALNEFTTLVEGYFELSEDHPDFDCLSGYLSSLIYDESLESKFWNSESYKEDMQELSKRFPQLQFDIIGDGESTEDLWAETWVDGKSHHRMATFLILPFDPEQLQ